MAAHSSAPAWRIPWTGEPGGLQTVGSQRDGHDFAATETALIVLDKFPPKHPVFLWAKDVMVSSLQGSLTPSYSRPFLPSSVLGAGSELLHSSLCQFIPSSLQTRHLSCCSLFALSS